MSISIRVDVVRTDGQVFRLTGRVARLVLWLCEHAERLNCQERGELVFGFRGELGTFKLTELGEM